MEETPGAAIAVLVVGLATVLLLGGGNSNSHGTPQTEQAITDTAGSGAAGSRGRVTT